MAQDLLISIGIGAAMQAGARDEAFVEDLLMWAEDARDVLRQTARAWRPRVR